MAGPSAQQIAGSLSGGSLSELRKRIFFVITALIIFRIGTFLPVPGIDINVMREIFEQQRTGILVITLRGGRSPIMDHQLGRGRARVDDRHHRRREAQ